MSERPAADDPSHEPLVLSDGARWVRADFHLHTRADREFTYTGEENRFVARYVEELRRAEIRVGVITNHNKFDLNEFKALRKKARTEGIVLLPGVELSVNDGANGIHTLIVFSDEWIAHGDRINPFLTSMFVGKTPTEYENKNGRSSCSLAETIAALERLSRPYFLVFAHVEQRSGLWREIDGGRIADLGCDEHFRRATLGFQKVRTHDGATSGNPSRTTVKGWLKDWYPAEVEGSDPKALEDIGKGPTCYLKLGELSFEAVRFALTAHEARVALTNMPLPKGSYIRSLHVEGGVLDGRTVEFSPGLNTLIGIRGSGKSSILEVLRYALDIPRGKKPQDVQYKDELVRHVLGSGGKVTLTAVDPHGQQFQIERIYREQPRVYLQGKLQPGVSICETILRRPIYFGQKDLSSTGDGFETDLVEKLVGDKLRPLRVEIEAQRQRVKEAAERWAGLGNITERIQEQEDARRDAEFNLATFEAHGIAERLRRRDGFGQDDRAMQRMRQRAKDYVLSLEELVAEHEDKLRNASCYTSTENPELLAAYVEDFALLTDNVESLKALVRDATAVRGRLDERHEQFKQTLVELQEDFAQVERQLTQELRQTGQSTINTNEFHEQRRRLATAQEKLEVLRQQESQQGIVRDALLAAVEELNELWTREFGAIQQELDRVNRTATSLQIEATFQGQREAAIGFMKDMFRGSNIRETTLHTAMADKADFGALFRALVAGWTPPGATPEVFRETFIKQLPEFLVWQVPNQFVIRFHGKELQHHSLGQRASALLLYVLSQRHNDVVIIDQPEDDLDNQTIYDEVIKLLRELKPEIQFIFATHNANFPVLGDAEQVLSCHYKDHRIEVESGSIDARRVQDDIIRIMEGGREAFNRRNEVYRQWKPRS
jgi:chromosome segregation protein